MPSWKLRQWKSYVHVTVAHLCTIPLTPLEQARAAAEPQAADFNDDTSYEDKSRAVPTKVNIRGLDNFTTQDIRQFASEHYSTEQLQQRVEWIDDTSANVVYNTEEAAAEALKAFSDLSESIPEQLSLLQSRRAKPLSSHPDTDLEVRLATGADVKAPRAHERSRFYLMNPDHDPRERKRDYDDRSRRGGRRPDNRRNRTRDEPQQRFHVNMYDDDVGGAPEPGEVDRPRRTQDNDNRRRRPTRANDEDLFANKSNGRLRDRSASPVREADGRFGFDDDQPKRRQARPRSFSPPARTRDLHQSTETSNAALELFPGKGRASALDNSMADDSSAIELFPNKQSSPPKRNRELFPNKTQHSNHRRSDALNSEESTRVRRKSNPPCIPSSSSYVSLGSFADRVSGGPQHGILHDRPINGHSSGFSIKGSATDAAPGFSIRGASREVNPVVKELFPSKLGSGSSGRDLFEDKMKSKNQQRRRAEDLF